jgi:Arc/MetJ-type ribon-helix-helix transcriptional regulator
MNVTLKPALKKLVEEKVKAGEYRSTDELLEAAIARLIFGSHVETGSEKKKAPSLRELNRRLAATKPARLAAAEKNCMRITGKTSL